MWDTPQQGRSSFMAFGQIQPSGWKRQVEKVMREHCLDRLTARVHDAEWAIFQRWQELDTRRDMTDERIELAAAVEELLSVKIYRLNWPDFRSEGLDGTVSR